MDPGVRAKAEALIKSGKLSPEEMTALKAALAEESQEPGADPNEARAQRMDQAEQTFAEETSPWGLAKSTAGALWDKAKGLGRGVERLATPETYRQLATQPEARRELGRGLSDSMFGFPVWLGDKLGVTHYGETEAHDAAQPEVKDIRTAGAIAGTLTPGAPAQALGRGAYTLALRTGLTPAMAALAAAQATSGGGAAVHTALEGGTAGDTAGAALAGASDPMNLMAPLGVKAAQKVKQGAGALTRAMRDDKSALGGGADTLEQLDSMRERGAVEGNLRRKVNDPDLANLPRGKKGYVKAAQNARDTIGGNTTGDLKAARAQYAKDWDAIASEHGDQPYSMEGPQTRINEMRAENTVNGEVVDDALGAALDKAERMITVKSPESAGNPAVAQASARESTVADMLKVKKAMDAKAEWGTPPTPENRPYRRIAIAFAKQAEGIDPRIAEMNAKYQSTMGRLEETNDILYNQDAKEVADRPALRRRAAGKLMRTGDDTTAGELGEEDIDRLADLDQRNARPIQTLKDKKALERTRFGMPNMSKSPEKWGVGLLEQNTEAARARLVDPLARRLAAMGLDSVTAMIIRARLAQQAAQQGDNQ